MARKQASMEMQRVGASRPAPLVEVPVPDIGALLGAWSCDPDERADLEADATGPGALCRVLVVVRIAYRWLPGTRAERDRWLDDLIWRVQFTDVQERAHAWLAALPPASVAAIDRWAASLAAVLDEREAEERRAPLPTPWSAGAARACEERREDLEMLAVLLGAGAPALRAEMSLHNPL